ncbi:hypothetical protein MHK_011015 [Candidatus Magnetomorum sp. HK-1]|nr:hypothetical protein MHK_011015 [Candidatus Magnetomorum sp. HK-1]
MNFFFVRKKTISTFMILYFIVQIIIINNGFCYADDEVVSKEYWESSFDGIGKGEWVIKAYKDGSLKVDGKWQYTDIISSSIILCPFRNGSVKKNDTTTSFEATGIAIAIQGNINGTANSAFLLKVNMDNRTQYFTYIISFIDISWPTNHVSDSIAIKVKQTYNATGNWNYTISDSWVNSGSNTCPSYEPESGKLYFESKNDEFIVTMDDSETEVNGTIDINKYSFSLYDPYENGDNINVDIEITLESQTSGKGNISWIYEDENNSCNGGSNITIQKNLTSNSNKSVNKNDDGGGGCFIRSIRKF